MSAPVIPCADVLRPISIGQLALSLELLEERLAEILHLTNVWRSLQIAEAAARAEVNVDQIRRHLAELGIALPETAEPK